MTGGTIPFRKMNGLGNEFVVFDGRSGPVRLAPEAISTLGQPGAIGFDQMITIERSKSGADAFMRIHNRDGGEVDACGNATRCIGWLLMGESGRKNATIETNAGLLRAYDTGYPEMISVDMGKPRFRWDEIPLSEAFAGQAEAGSDRGAGRRRRHRLRPDDHHRDVEEGRRRLHAHP